MDDPNQPALFGETPQAIRGPAPERRPLTAEDVRAMMLDLIATARAAETMPFEQHELKRHVALFPIMAQWLSPDEGEQLTLAFEAEVERLRRAA